MRQRLEVPNGWQCTELKDIAIINPKLPFDKIPDDSEVSFLPMKLVETEINKIHLSEFRKYSDVRKGFTPMTDGDVIFAKITPCMENGKIAVVHSLRNKIAFGSTEFHVFRCNETTINFYLFYFLVQSQVRQDAQHNMTGAVGQRRVPIKYLEKLKIPIPPLPEQHRIVAKIEELFSSVDKGIESLKTAQQQLKVYRQAVLKWAFEGKLTNKNVVEGKLPDGWQYNKINELGRIETGTTPSKKNPNFYSDEYPFYKPTDLNAGNNVVSSTDGLSEIGLKEARFVPASSTLVTCIGATIGKTGFIKKGGGFNQQINAIIPSKEHNPKFIYYQAVSPDFQKQIQNNASATTLPILNKGKFENLIMACCLPEEQQAIVAEIESRLSVCDKIEENIGHSLKQAEALRQSILKKAFEGKLVPQDPNDEPASVLLARIKAERESNKAETLRHRQTKKKKSHS